METVLGMTDLQIRLFTAIGQIAVAGIVGYIAFQQWRTARKKLKADLFDRRFQAYRELVDVTKAAISNSTAETTKEKRSMSRGAVEIERISMEMAWVFDRRIAAFVRANIADPAAALAFDRIDYFDCHDPEERKRQGLALRNLERDIFRDLGRVTSLVTPYLNLEH
ncbi:hypothetical protein [Stenotrophomonas sp. SY1]|uniref:hypothetical protein n=1 Tax=Stenotrophomonas sp. SY1 TaxID=477235 RepID=UPI001E5A79AD|nr:hypothetical protein [Stenotrophomonas sp. SY1]MCD9087381.1 hypothetical protein [Stenotrophomonas sp. SY1]